MRGVDSALRCSGGLRVMSAAGRASAASRCSSTTAMATLYRVVVTYDGRCFGCGEDNDAGLKMRFTPAEDGSVCEFEVPERFQSWRGMVHGGMVSLMLDEAVGWAAWHAGRPGLTGRLEVRYRRPPSIGQRVRGGGRGERRR